MAADDNTAYQPVASCGESRKSGSEREAREVTPRFDPDQIWILAIKRRREPQNTRSQRGRDRSRERIPPQRRYASFPDSDLVITHIFSSNLCGKLYTTIQVT
ncbi:MAG: hypothetical protein GDA43_06120 [Hormoscilla sp. SP5CHS1]|nr:hypothetical protein [Hormoscilla sp. SP12CHS1]MBC6452827.1 hypothetical protein [Hormoscilla sp. SP5CHS1]